MVDEPAASYRCRGCGKSGSGRYFYLLHFEDCTSPPPEDQPEMEVLSALPGLPHPAESGLAGSNVDGAKPVPEPDHDVDECGAAAGGPCLAHCEPDGAK